MADEMRLRIKNAAVQGNIALGISLADRLGIFSALDKAGSETSPAHYEAVAKEAKLKPRYTKELLSLLSCGDIITVVPDGEHFYLNPAQAEVLNSTVKDTGVGMCLFLSLHAQAFHPISEVFQLSGPLGMEYANYDDFYSVMDEFSISLHKKHLISDLVPLTGMKEALESGISFLDVGCGNGFHIAELAQAFKKSTFTGVDLTPVAVKKANERIEKLGLTNATFIQTDARAMNSTWNDKFEFVMIFDACHDQCRPDLVLKEIYRVLKPGGVFAMVEIDGTSNVYEDRQKFGIKCAAMYSSSVFHCLPVGSNTPDALAMGTMMGTKKGRELLFGAGFTDVKIENIPFFELNVLYLAKK